MAGFKNILVPTDFSKASAAALKYACELADAVNASLCVLHTVEKPYPIAGYYESYTLPQEFFDTLERRARTELEGVLTPEQKEKYGAALVLRHGVAAQEILQYLQEHPEIDLVIMATHGRGGVARLMMGSVADKVVRAAPCPVVTLRIGEAAEPKTSRAA
jgi:nucleotide-binding universal stress UspA family protein